MTTLPAPIQAAQQLLDEYHAELMAGGEPHYPHEAERIVKEYLGRIGEEVGCSRS